jgi:hypothetical protein
MMLLRLTLAGLVTVAGVPSAGIADAQTPPATESASSHTLTVVRRDGQMYVSLTTQNARLSDVAADLSRQSGVPVTVSRAIASERLWTGFTEAPFEWAVARLTSRAYVDYMLRPNAAEEPVLVQLLAPDESVAAPPGAAMGVLITGNTETVSDATHEDPLRISLDFNGLTVVVQRQPLSVVLAAVAETLGVPFVAEYAANDPITIGIMDKPETAVLRLSPNVRLRVRADLSRNERTIQRIVLVAP